MATSEHTPTTAARVEVSACGDGRTSADVARSIPGGGWANTPPWTDRPADRHGLHPAQDMSPTAYVPSASPSTHGVLVTGDHVASVRATSGLYIVTAPCQRRPHQRVAASAHAASAHAASGRVLLNATVPGPPRPGGPGTVGLKSAVHELGLLVEDLGASRDEVVVRLVGGGDERRCAVAVLECEADAEVAFDR